MNIDNMKSEYENERSSLIFSLYAAYKDPKRLEELRKEIKELDEILEKLQNEKEKKEINKTSYKSSDIDKEYNDDDFER